MEQPTLVVMRTRHSPVKSLVGAFTTLGSSPTTTSSSGGSTTSSQNNELGKYLNMKWADMYMEYFDVLRWWKEHEHTFPILSRFARDMLSVPVSTVSLESAFSQTGRIIEDRRTCLSPELVEALTCVKDWDAAQ